MTKLNLVPVSGTAMVRHSKLHKIDVFCRKAHKIQKFYAENVKNIHFYENQWLRSSIFQ